MMRKLLAFELKKSIKLRKFLWLLIIILLVATGLLIQNKDQESSRSDRAADKLVPYFTEIGNARETLQELSREGKADDVQTLQLEALKNIGASLTQWKVAINNGKWNETPIYEMEFWQGIKQYESHGGHFTSLQGMDREIAIKKNKWMVDRRLVYDDEQYPLSPGLLMDQIAEWLFSLWGLVIVVLLFGTVVSGEREQNTWSMMKTQPIGKLELYVAKFLTAAISVGLSIGLVFLIGLGLPLLFTDFKLNLDYPQVITFSDNFVITTTINLFLREAILFFGSGLIIFSLVLLISNWLKGSFITLLCTALSFLSIFVFSLQTDLIKMPWNPFFVIQSLGRTQEITGNEVLAALISSCIWAVVILSLTIGLKERNIELLQDKTVCRPFAGGGTNKKQSVISKLFVFEWRKTWRRGNLLQVTIVLLLLTSFHFVSASLESKALKEEYLYKLDNLDSELDILNFLKEQSYENEKMNNDDSYVDLFKEEREKAIIVLEEEVRLAKSAYSAYLEGNWIPFYQYQQFVDRKFNSEFETGILGYQSSKQAGQLALDASIEEKSWLMKYNLQPVFKGEFIITPFSSWNDKEKEIEQRWNNDNKRVDSSGIFSLYSVFTNHYVFVMMIILFFLFGGGIAAERGKNATIRFLLTQPCSLTSIYQAKWLSGLTISLIISLGVFTFALLIGSLFNRLGDWMYPVLYYDTASVASSDHYGGFQSQGMGFHFIPMGEYVLQAILLFCLGLTFLLTLSHVLGLFMNRFSAMVLTFILSLGGYFLSIKIFTQAAYYSPFTFLNSAKIANGELAATLNNSNITVLMGSMVLLGSIFALWMIGIVYTKRKRT